MISEQEILNEIVFLDLYKNLYFLEKHRSSIELNILLLRFCLEIKKFNQHNLHKALVLVTIFLFTILPIHLINNPHLYYLSWLLFALAIMYILTNYILNMICQMLLSVADYLKK